MTPLNRSAVPGYALVLALIVSAPVLAPGYLLIRDAVSTPRSYLTDAALGIGENAPRAVPQDFAVAALSAVIDGGIVVKTLLIAGLFLAGWGAGRLAAQLIPDAGTPGQLVAATVAIWNPYVAERLLQGHWSLLVGYGCLPWVASSVIRIRAGSNCAGDSGVGGNRAGANRFGDWAAVVLWIALAGLTPTGLLMAALVALVCAGFRAGAAILVIAGAAAMPWLVAAAFGNAMGVPQAAGLAPFAARAEPGLATLGSLAGLGGIWNAEAVPHSRTSGFAMFGTALLLTVVACGIPVILRRRFTERLLMLAVAAVLFPAAMATGPGMSALRAGVDAVPALAVVRDAQKWVALAMPAYALAGAAAVLVLGRWLRPAVAGLICCAALLVALPDLAWGVGGALRPVHYPPGWAAAAERVNAEPETVAVLPAGTMRRFAWSGSAPVLDPWPRWVRAEVLTTGDLTIGGQTVSGEGARAREVQRLLEAGSDPAVLARAGVGWLVVQRGTPGDIGEAGRALRELSPAYADADIELYRIGGVSPVAPHDKRMLVIAAHLVWVALLSGGAAISAVSALRRRRPS